MIRVLLIEDDPLLGAGLQVYLEEQGLDCIWLMTTQSVATSWYLADIVILDRQMPEGDSIDYLPEWLSLKALPVIVLTARTDVVDRVSGLQAGAKDYVTKPFIHEELVARIYAQLRPLGESIINYGNLVVNTGQRSAVLAGIEVALKPKEFQLLLLLVKSPGRVYHRDEILNKVWGLHSFPSSRTVDNHVLALRQKIPLLQIETIRGVGYRLKEEK